MGKNKARHILHGVLDCLPIILIPIFMIYSQNHEINDNTLQVQENKVVDFNQLVKFSDYDNTLYGIRIITNGDEGNISANGVCSDSFNSNICTINVIQNHKYLYTNNPTNMPISNTNVISLQLYGVNTIYSDITENSTTGYKIAIASGTGTAILRQRFQIGNNYNLEYTPQVYDLSAIFGLGNEPTIEQFKTYFPLNYYPYTESEEVVIENYETITYNDTDIMSQSFYCLYNAVDKYFNMGNVFGMKNLYTWFETNIFGGTASPSIYIVWNIVLYEFIMDLLFLLYGLFMFFIDLCKRLMEKPLNSIK